jgi:hypothetical protein
MVPAQTCRGERRSVTFSVAMITRFQVKSFVQKALEAFYRVVAYRGTTLRAIGVRV